MITKTTKKDNNSSCYSHSFEFTEEHIYDYVRCFVESADQLALLNLLIEVYEDENKKDAVKLLMKEQRNVVYTVSCLDDDTMYPHINSLFLNQK